MDSSLLSSPCPIASEVSNLIFKYSRLVRPASILRPAKKVPSLHSSKTGKDRSHPEPLYLGGMIAHLLIKDIYIPKSTYRLLFTLILLHSKYHSHGENDCSSFVPRILVNKSPTHAKSASPPEAASLNLQSSIRNPQSPISNPQSAIFNLQSPILNPQSPISNHQSPIINHQSAILNLQSSITNLQSIDLPVMLF
jgi:hypothetical protein